MGGTMDSNKKNNEYSVKKIVKVFLIVLVALLGFTYILAWIVSTPNSILGIFAIPNFKESNDWIGFGGYVLTSVITVGVYFGTLKQTRDIQKENAQIQKLDRKNAIKPRLDIDVPSGAFIKYDMNDEELRVEIEDIRLDSETNFNKDKDASIHESLIRILNLSPNAIAKNVNINITTSINDIIENLKKMNMKVSESNIEDSEFLIFNDKQESILLLSGKLNEERLIESDDTYRFLRGNDEIILDLVVYTGLEIKEVMKVLLYAYIKNTPKPNIKGLSFSSNEVKLLEFNVKLECEDIEFEVYDSEFIVSVIADSIQWDEKEVIISINITDIKRDGVVKKESK